MNPVLVKSLISAGLAGAVGLGGYGIYSVAFRTPSKTISQVIQDDPKLDLLSTNEGEENNADWESKVDEIKKNSSAATSIGFVESKATQDEEKKKANVAALKKICKGLIELDSKDESKLEQAKKWCAKSKVTA